MKRSKDIDKLVAALIKAQKIIQPAPNDGTNPDFNHRYATINAIKSAVNKPLLDNGLCISQLLDESIEGAVLVTMLMHESGQFISSTMRLLTDGNSMQDLGSAISYAKRYSIGAITGVISEIDDDGRTAKLGAAAPTPEQAAKKTKPFPHLEPDPGTHRVRFGKYRGQTLKQIDIYDLANYYTFLEQKAKSEGGQVKPLVKEFMINSATYLNSRLPKNNILDAFGPRS